MTEHGSNLAVIMYSLFVPNFKTLFSELRGQAIAALHIRIFVFTKEFTCLSCDHHIPMFSVKSYKSILLLQL